MPSIGVDVGTASARVAILSGGTPVAVEDASGARSVPCAVALDADPPKVGAAALRLAAARPDVAVRAPKKLLGRVGVSVGGHSFAPEWIYARVLDHLLAMVQRQFDEPPSAAVLCAPAWFRAAQRDALERAAELANLPPPHVLREPTAIALTLCQRLGAQTGASAPRVAIVDVGAGGTSAAVFSLSSRRLRLLGMAGDELASGEGADDALVDWAVAELGAQLGRAPPDDAATRERLRQSCEELKRDLSAMPSSTVRVPYLPPARQGELCALTLNRWRLRELLGELVERIGDCCRQALLGAGMRRGSFTDLDLVYLAGGMARLGVVRERVQAAFGKKPEPGQRPEEVVALGAARMAGIIEGVVDEIDIDEGRAATGLPPPVTGEPDWSPPPFAPALGADTPAPPGAAEGAAEPALTTPTPPPVAIDDVPRDEPRPAGEPAADRGAAWPEEPAPPTLREGREPAAAAGSARAGEPEPAPDDETVPPPTPSTAERRLLGIVRRGRFVNPTSPQTVLELALARRVRRKDLVPVALPVLLCRVLTARPLSGALRLERGPQRAELTLVAGRGELGDGEREALLDAFTWPVGGYTFESEVTVPRADRRSTDLVALTAAGLKELCNRFAPADIEEALGARLALVPRLRADRAYEIRQLGLDPGERHLLLESMSELRTGRESLQQATTERDALRKLLLVLCAFDLVVWRGRAEAADKAGTEPELAELLDEAPWRLATPVPAFDPDAFIRAELRESLRPVPYSPVPRPASDEPTSSKKISTLPPPPPVSMRTDGGPADKPDRE
ncbi:MAG: Hsp70 family protein [Deltaproteobacteria bacterium]|nr:Hsp70 family protein [Deltaproteobacteria bacterium]